MRRPSLRAVSLLLALVLGQALFVLHAAQHPLTASVDYDCVICAHGFDGQQALTSPGPAVPVIEQAATRALLQLSPPQVSALFTQPPIRGPPLLLA